MNINKFIKATNEFNTFEKNVPAPYLRKSFVSDTDSTAKIVIAACGFYELYFNGKRYTKGYLAPYISNTDDYIYCDEYEIPVDKGENVIGLLLGNGFQNNPGGHIWDFDKAPFRSAPLVAMTLSYKSADGNEIVVETDSTFKTFPSPILSDDYRFGEYYDANCEISGWNEKNFDDSAWNNAIETLPPRGELRLCTVEPIVKETEIKPVEIIKAEDGYIYDFGIVNAGICRLNIKGEKGQKVEMVHFEGLDKNGEPLLKNLWFNQKWDFDKDIVHKDIYVCNGSGNETYTPTFVYHGFRYVKVTGITPGQATKELLTYLVIHSNIKSRGGFTCSDKTVNTLQEITRRSDISNFHYFPTDCPQREKNGWTADAALSCEHVMLNFAPEKSYKEWLKNICKAQNELGALPGIIPTTGWGFHWGNGPAWDCVLAYLPYYMYIYRGDTDTIKDCAHAFMKYLHYLTTRNDADGTIHIGLGDWCHINDIRPPKAPLVVTDTVISMDIANKMAVMFDAVGMVPQRDFALTVAGNYKAAIRKNLIDFETMTVKGSCQSSQAMCIYYGVFTPEETEKAVERLIDFVHEADEHIDIGVLGARVIFHVLSRFGYTDLALKMIIRPDFPSYGNWIAQGATTLWERFLTDRVDSMNHHFWGDISAWFIKCLAGIQFNPNLNDISEVDIRPCFATALDNAEGYYEAPMGKIVSGWKKENGKITLTLEIPDGVKATAYLENGFAFEDGTACKKVASGQYTVKCL
ncbi:MAG: hypothetical protein E7588_03300 [Ruminococcaceae bacterium]|nr:hypothetical protein [Oscillospiraceae bacterium]